MLTEESTAGETEEIMPVLEAFNATEDVVEAPIATNDGTEDVEASTSIDEVSMTKKASTAALGSIWVPDPMYGMVRRPLGSVCRDSGLFGVEIGGITSFQSPTAFVR